MDENKKKVLEIMDDEWLSFYEKADAILALFNVVDMFPSDDEIEQAAEENASRLYAIDSCQDTEWYATHHGFMDGADFVRNKLSSN
jgi:hypothetical protein